MRLVHVLSTIHMTFDPIQFLFELFPRDPIYGLFLENHIHNSFTSPCSYTCHLKA